MRIVFFFFFSFLLVGHLGTSLLWWPPPNQYTNGLFSNLDFAPCYLQPLPWSDWMWHWWSCARRQVGYGRVPMPHPQKEGRQLNCQTHLALAPQAWGSASPCKREQWFPPWKITTQGPYPQLSGASTYKHFKVKLIGTGGRSLTSVWLRFLSTVSIPASI